jgi:hypothetical protein
VSLEQLARRTFFVPVAAVRPYLVLKTTLLMLGFDLWLTRASHGGRYGAGGFNVAHFEWLGTLQGSLITPGLYVGLVTLLGVLCMVLALAPRPPRWLIGVAALLLTWSWAMSMLDSYQHHYLLGLVVTALVFFPRLTAEEALLPPTSQSASEPAVASATEPARKKGKRSKGKVKTSGKAAEPERAPSQPAEAPLRDLLASAPTVPTWAYALLSTSTALVYAYTAYAKTADEWLRGAALMRVLGLREDGTPPPGAEDRIGFFRELVGSFGIEGESFWWMMGHSVVLVQMICAAGYFLAPFRDVTRSRSLKIFSGVACSTALSFHFGAEIMELKIGWFSAYMILYAFFFFLPASWLVVLARVALPIRGVGLRTEVLAMRIGLGLLVGLLALWLDSWALGSVAILLVVVTPIRFLVGAIREDDGRVPMPAALAAAALGAVALVGVGYLVDLPGVEIASTIGAAALGLGAVLLLVLRGHPRGIHPYGVATLLGALSLYASFAYSDVRYDFYRNVGGDHRRRGELLTAYQAYVKANRYAPEGQNRRRQEEELRQTLEQRGLLPRRQ